MNNERTKIYFKSVLILAPIDSLSNWYSQFKQLIQDNGLSIQIFKFDDCTTNGEKIKLFKKWQELGGVTLISHLEFIDLIMKKDQPEDLVNLVNELILNTDLLVIDKGHLIVKEEQFKESLVGIKTRRRIILTDELLNENNLEVYYAMCDFVRPSLLGDYDVFKSYFINCQDPNLIARRMRKLHSRLHQVIYHANYSEMQKELPTKLEFILKVKLSKIQNEFYSKFEAMCDKQNKQDKANVNYSIRMLIFRYIANHPAMLNYLKFFYQDWFCEILSKNQDLIKINKSGFSPLISSKVQLFLLILKFCERKNEKLVVIVQDLPMLELIEHVLRIEESSRAADDEFRTFIKGVDYYRLDENSLDDEMQSKVDCFNDIKNNQARLFLLSKCSYMDLSLIGANRCIIFDVSWNVDEDLKSIIKTYRYGQTKEVYVYRFVTLGREEKVCFKNLKI